MMKHNRKGILLAVLLIVVLLVPVGGTMAFLKMDTTAVTNMFEPAEVACDVQAGNSIKNTGGVEAYIRAAVVATWVNDETSAVYGKAPDLTVEPGSGWVSRGDYYYWQDPVAVNASTGALAVSAKDAPNGYHLEIHILAQAIQSEPETAAESAWGIIVSDGKIQ